MSVLILPIASSLLSRDPQSHQLSVHRLVQVVLVDQMDESSRRQWAERTVHAVSATFPEEIDHPAWPQCDRLLPHALRCASLIEDYQLTFPKAARLLNQTGLYLKARARYQEADDARHVLGSFRATQRDRRKAFARILTWLFAELVDAYFSIELREHVGVHETWTHAVDSNAVARVAQRQATRHADDRRFADRVWQSVR